MVSRGRREEGLDSLGKMLVGSVSLARFLARAVVDVGARQPASGRIRELVVGSPFLISEPQSASIRASPGKRR